MRRYLLKLVPNGRPNAPGRWVDRYFDRPPTFETEAEPGFHIVAIRQEDPGPPDQPFYMHSARR